MASFQRFIIIVLVKYRFYFVDNSSTQDTMKGKLSEDKSEIRKSRQGILT